MIQRGVTAGLPNKVTHPHWDAVAASVKALPACWLREDFLFWEVCWTPGVVSDPVRLEAVLKLAIASGKKLMLNVVPCPHPTAEGWQKRMGGPWDTWMRPDFRLWETIRDTLQLAIDHCVAKWEAMGGKKSALVFEWYNEPATGHVSGGNPAKEAIGMWSKSFHSFCNFLLLGKEGINFHGYKLVAPTLSFFGEGEAEKIERKSSTDSHAEWWQVMQRRCVNLGIYLPKQVRVPEEAATQYRAELERIMGVMKSLPIPVQKTPIRIHEWYVSKPMLGYRQGECDDSFRAECILAIGEVIASYRDIEAAFFFTHYFGPENVKTPYDDHSAFSGPCRTAMVRYLAGR